MRVSLVEESSGIIEDAWSNNEGTVILSQDSLTHGKDYTLRFDLFEKEVVQASEDGGECKHAHINLQLLIMDKRLV